MFNVSNAARGGSKSRAADARTFVDKYVVRGRGAAAGKSSRGRCPLALPRPVLAATARGSSKSPASAPTSSVDAPWNWVQHRPSVALPRKPRQS